MKFKPIKTVVFTTVFDGIELFFNDFLESLELQTYKDFSLVIANDNFSKLNTYTNKSSIKDIHVIDVNSAPAENRVIGIKECIDLGADIIIFADSDDTFDKNRVETAHKYLLDKNFDILINDINICSSELKIINKNYFSKRLENNYLVKFQDILNCNFCGLSNSAIKTNLIKNTPIIANDPFDWMLFSCLLLKSPKAVYTNETSTHYRQHNSNFIGMRNMVNDDKIKHSIDIKAKHYKILEENNDTLEELSEYFNKISSMEREELKNYYEYCYSNYHKNAFWWEEAKKMES